MKSISCSSVSEAAIFMPITLQIFKRMVLLDS
jgi:hypothetical protein